VVAGELLEDVFGGDAERVLRLHELETARGAGEEIGEAGALRRGNEFRVVFFARDVRG
jgi:hypothetical protein